SRPTSVWCTTLLPKNEPCLSRRARVDAERRIIGSLRLQLAQEPSAGIRVYEAQHARVEYALGALWYDMALWRPADEPVWLRLVDGTQPPKDAEELLGSLLAPQP